MVLRELTDSWVKWTLHNTEIRWLIGTWLVLRKVGFISSVWMFKQRGQNVEEEAAKSGKFERQRDND